MDGCFVASGRWQLAAWSGGAASHIRDRQQGADALVGHPRPVVVREGAALRAAPRRATVGTTQIQRVCEKAALESDVGACGVVTQRQDFRFNGGIEGRRVRR